MNATKERNKGVEGTREMCKKTSTGVCWSGSGGAITKNHPTNTVSGREGMRARVRAGAASFRMVVVEEEEGAGGRAESTSLSAVMSG